MSQIISSRKVECTTTAIWTTLIAKVKVRVYLTLPLHTVMFLEKDSLKQDSISY